MEPNPQPCASSCTERNGQWPELYSSQWRCQRPAIYFQVIVMYQTNTPKDAYPRTSHSYTIAEELTSDVFGPIQKQGIWVKAILLPFWMSRPGSLQPYRLSPELKTLAWLRPPSPTSSANSDEYQNSLSQTTLKSIWPRGKKNDLPAQMRSKTSTPLQPARKRLSGKAELHTARRRKSGTSHYRPWRPLLAACHACSALEDALRPPSVPGKTPETLRPFGKLRIIHLHSPPKQKMENRGQWVRYLFPIDRKKIWRSIKMALSDWFDCASFQHIMWTITQRPFQQLNINSRHASTERSEKRQWHQNL